MPIYGSQPLQEWGFPGSAPVISNICVGSADGNIYATLESAGRIAQIKPGNTQGKLSLIQLPQVGTFGGINAGSDGRIWYSDQQNLKINAYDPVIGSVTGQFNVPSLPSGVVCGSDGNMWVMSNTQIFRISPQGSQTAFPTTGGPHGPNLGWDGNVYFVLNSKQQVGYITPQGTVTLSASMPGVTGLYVINRGADGNMWASCDQGQQIVKVTTGTFAYQTFAIQGSAGGTCPGPDGNVYYSDRGANNVGWISPFGVASQQGVVQTAATFTTGGSHSTQVALANPVSASDIVLAYVHSNNASGAINGPAGFSQIGTQVYGASVTMAAYYAAVGAGGSTVTVGASVPAGLIAIEAYDLAGTLGAGAIDTFASVYTPSTTSVALGPASPTTQNTMGVAALGVTGAGVGNTSFTNSWTGGFAQDGSQDSHEEWAHLSQYGAASQIATTETIAAARNCVGFLTLVKMQPQMAGQNAMHEQPLPTAAAYPDKIVGGSDGGIWYSEYGAGRIGRLQPVQWFTYNGPFDAEVQAGEEYWVRIPLSQRGVSMCAPVAIASQLAAGDAGWFTFY